MRRNFWDNGLVRLRSLEPEDAPVFFEWNQDSDMSRNLDFIWPPTSLKQVQNWVNTTSAERAQSDEHFLVIENEERALVGTINTNNCRPREGSFGYGIAVRRDYQRHGYASQAIQLVLRYFFNELRYQKATIKVYEFNEASIQLHRRLGFVQEGRIRRMVYHNGRHYDDFIFGMTREEFEEKFGEG